MATRAPPAPVFEEAATRAAAFLRLNGLTKPLPTRLRPPRGARHGGAPAAGLPRVLPRRRPPRRRLRGHRPFRRWRNCRFGGPAPDRLAGRAGGWRARQLQEEQPPHLDHAGAAAWTVGQTDWYLVDGTASARGVCPGFVHQAWLCHAGADAALAALAALDAAVVDAVAVIDAFVDVVGVAAGAARDDAVVRDWLDHHPMPPLPVVRAALASAPAGLGARGLLDHLKDAQSAAR